MPRCLICLYFLVLLLGFSFAQSETSQPKRSGGLKKKGVTTSSASKPGSTSRPAVKKLKFDSIDDLGKALFEGLRKRDGKHLHSLRVSRDWYVKEFLPRWLEVERPQVKDSNPEIHWMLTETNSLAGVSQMLSDYSGRELVLVRAQPGSVKDYGPYKLWRKNIAFFRLKDKEEIYPMALGPIVEVKGKFQFLAYPE